MDKTQKFSGLFTAEDVLCNPAQRERDALLKEMLTRLAVNHGIGNAHHALEAVLAREAAFPALLCPGVALPHARLDTIGEVVVSVAVSENGVTFPTASDPVHLVVLLLVPKSQPAAYLQALRMLAQVFESVKDPAALARKLRTPEDVKRFFETGATAVSGFVRAADIMSMPEVVLRDTDRLKDAVDVFAHRRTDEAPVVDCDGEMVGVVSAQALMRVCLPDYLLWMDDLTPLADFEPFTRVLLHEESTWLAEILLKDFHSVQADEPAILAAAEMTRGGAGQCYVLRGKKLCGVIPLGRFLHKVLRE
ncbi:MAG: PTS sugar transporter subunit IIA [Kiritimatiellaeota bacterium]|nr:PTS sugar transporter subunit IIA [Kiritimatiellota bacterium]